MDRETPPKDISFWRRWGGWIKLCVTAGMLAAIFRFVPLHLVVEGISRTNPFVWGLVFVLFLIGHALAAFKWRLLTDRSLPYLAVIKAHFGGLAANLALPGVAGGDVARAALVARSVTSKSDLIAGSLLDRLIDTGILVIIAALGAAMIGGAGKTGFWLGLVAGGLITVGAISYALAPQVRNWTAEIIGPEPSSKVKQVMLALANYVGENRNRIVVCAGLSFAIQLGFVTLNAMLSHSMGGPADLALWMLAWPLAKLVATIPISIGGLGVREASLASVFAAIGAASPIVISVGFVWQTILISAGLLGLGLQFASKNRDTAANQETSNANR